MNQKPSLQVCIPTYNRTTALAATLTSLALQADSDFSVVIADQSDKADISHDGSILTTVRLLQQKGRSTKIYHRNQRLGMAEQRQFLLHQVASQYCLFLDDDLILEPWVLQKTLEVIEARDCGFVGRPVIGLSYVQDRRPNEQEIEFWEGPVHPETIAPQSPKWERYRLHNAANPLHLQEKYHLTPDRQKIYKIAWVGGFTLYHTQKLKSVGGFNFHQQLPEDHCGEDVLAQLRVMSHYGACGILPSGVYHQELPTTLPNRSHNAPELIPLHL